MQVSARVCRVELLRTRGPAALRSGGLPVTNGGLRPETASSGSDPDCRAWGRESRHGQARPRHCDGARDGRRPCSCEPGRKPAVATGAVQRFAIARLDCAEQRFPIAGLDRLQQRSAIAGLDPLVRPGRSGLGVRALCWRAAARATRSRLPAQPSAYVGTRRAGLHSQR